MSSWRERLESKWGDGKFLCVGLDPVAANIPSHLVHNRTIPRMRTVDRLSFNRDMSSVEAASIVRFNRGIIDATADIAGAYKLNLAFYLRWGASGLEALEDAISHIREVDPEAFIILDAKFADVKSTSEAGAGFAFERLAVDAITLNPYLGGLEALDPYIGRSDKLCIVLCRTSSPGSDEFQAGLVRVEPQDEWDDEYEVGATVPLYQRVAHRVSRIWNSLDNCGLVAGATYPKELGIIRKTASDLPLLIPGIGNQGGTVESVVPFALDDRGQGFLVNASSSICYASSGEDFADAARVNAESYHQQIKSAIDKYRIIT